MRSCFTISMFAALATGCVAGGEGGYSVAYAVPAPDLVYVAPGVQVIADYDYPVFFADGVYWRYDGGVWYRSRTYTGGWAITYDVPVTVRHIDRPATYVHLSRHRRRSHEGAGARSPCRTGRRAGGAPSGRSRSPPSLTRARVHARPA